MDVGELIPIVLVVFIIIAGFWLTVLSYLVFKKAQAPPAEKEPKAKKEKETKEEEPSTEEEDA